MEKSSYADDWQGDAIRFVQPFRYKINKLWNKKQSDYFSMLKPTALASKEINKARSMPKQSL